MVRIGFDPQDGSWSYVGPRRAQHQVAAGTHDEFRLAADHAPTATTRRCTRSATRSDSSTSTRTRTRASPGTARPCSTISRAPPNNWDESQIDWNILRKIPSSEIKGTTWDPDSVMEYQFDAGLIEAPAKYQAGLTPKGGLSYADKAWVVRVLPRRAGAQPPRTLKVGLSQLLKLKAGETRTFDFSPPRTRTYNIGTFGTSDTVLVLFEVDADRQRADRGRRRQRHRPQRQGQHAAAEGPPLPGRRASLLRRCGARDLADGLVKPRRVAYNRRLTGLPAW